MDYPDLRLEDDEPLNTPPGSALIRQLSGMGSSLTRSSQRQGTRTASIGTPLPRVFALDDPELTLVREIHVFHAVKKVPNFDGLVGFTNFG